MGSQMRLTFPLWPASNCPQANEVFYISGILTSGGDPKENRKVFERAQHMLLSAGCPVFNPIHIEWPIDPLKDVRVVPVFHAFLRACHPRM